MKVLSFNGITFASLNLSAGVPRGTELGPELRPLIMDRRAYAPLHVGVGRGSKTLDVACTVKPGFNVENGLLDALGIVDPYDETERLLKGELNDGTAIQTYAALAGYRWEDNSLVLTFSLADPILRKPTATTYGPLTWNGTAPAPPAVLAVPNAGKARANLNLILKPTALDTSVDVLSSRVTFTVTNNSDQTLRKFPLEIDLGDTSTWNITAGQLWLFLDGIAQPREVINIDDVQSYVWILVDELAPGATFTYELAWPGPSTGTDLVGANRPAFDITWEKNTATSGTTTTITKSSATWRVNQWTRGRIKLLSGTGAGQERYIASNTGTVITHDGAVWSPAPDATTVFLLTMSHNDRWVYDINQEERNNSNRGLWYINRGQTTPSVVNFDTPGAWHRILVLDNNDEKNQARWTPINVGGSDIDYFAILDADRTAQGWTSLREEGQADGVAFSSPVEIDLFRLNYTLKNPNAICVAKFGARESGAEDWEWFWEDDDASDTLVSSGILEQTFSDDMRHLVACLLPINEEEVPVSWKRDTGSHTASTTTTITDASKEWSTGQWINGTVKIVAGTGVGRSRTVTANTSTQLTVSSAWGITLGDDTRFEVRNKTLVATLRTQSRWEINLNTSKVVIGALSSIIFPSYSLQHNLQLAGGPDLNAPYQDIRIGMDSRYIFVAGTEELRIDGSARRAAIHTTSSGAKVKDVSSAVLVRTKETDGNFYLAPEWLLVQPTPTNPVVDPAFASGISNWAAFSSTAGLTFATSHDTGVGHVATGTMKIDVTASTAAGGATVQRVTPTAPPYFTVVPGRAYTVTAWGRRSSANWRPKLGIAWYDASDTLISSSVAGANAVDYVNANTTFFQIGHAALAPTTAASARVLAVAYENTSSTIGIVHFDEVIFNTSALFMTVQGTGISATLTPSLVEGFHG